MSDFNEYNKYSWRNTLREWRLKLDARYYSGYYKVFAYCLDDGLYSAIQYHRTDKLPNLEEVDGIIELLYDVELREKIKTDETDRIYILSSLDTLFTQSEVSELITEIHPSGMNIRIEPILLLGLDGNIISATQLPASRKTNGARRLRVNPKSYKFTNTAYWTCQPLLRERVR
jgi:hypothetical protein